MKFLHDNWPSKTNSLHLKWSISSVGNYVVFSSLILHQYNKTQSSWNFQSCLEWWLKCKSVQVNHSMPACALSTVIGPNHDGGGIGSFTENFAEFCIIPCKVSHKLRSKSPQIIQPSSLYPYRAPCTACTMPNSRKKTILFELRGLCERSATFIVSNWSKNGVKTYWIVFQDRTGHKICSIERW